MHKLIILLLIGCLLHTSSTYSASFIPAKEHTICTVDPIIGADRKIKPKEKIARKLYKKVVVKQLRSNAFVNTNNKQVLGWSSLVAGVLGIALLFAGISFLIPFAFSLTGLILGVVAVNTEEKKTMAWLGIISGLNFVLGLIVLITFASFFRDIF
jgi:hypothetical protein